jgi:hypothetical protein
MTEKHRQFIRSLPCCICGNNIETQWCHVRYADAGAEKPITGIGNRASPKWTLPLCNRHHEEQHKGGERAFWLKHRIDPIWVCLALWKASGNHELGCQILANARG